MKLEGIHHVTCITGDAPRNVEFYAGTLGLRLVKKTVNQDDPTVYHLFYADERGSAGRRHHLLRVPGRRARARRRRDGAPHRLPGRLRGGARLLGRARRAASARVRRACCSRDPEGLALELVVDDSGDEPLVAKHPEIPEELALRGFAGVRAYASDVGAERLPPLPARLQARLGGARRQARRLLRLRRPAAGARPLGRRHRAPRRVGLARRGARGLAREGDRRRAGSRRR